MSAEYATRPPFAQSTNAPARELILFEPQLSNFAGHFNHYVRVVAKEANRRGLKLTVAANRHVGQDLQAALQSIGVNLLPVFERLPPLSKVQNPTQQRQHIEYHANIALKCMAMRPEAKPAWLSGSYSLFEAAAMVAVRTQKPFAFQMLTFAHEWPAGTLTAPLRLREAAIQGVAAGMKIYAESRLLADHLQQEIGVPVAGFLPLLDQRPLPSRPLAARPVVGIMNMFRHSKNIGLALNPLVAQADSLRTVLHTGRISRPDMLDRLQKHLAALIDRNRPADPRITIVPGVLSAEDYVRVWHSLDATIMPYDPVRYARQGSGIVVESLADGIIPIAPEGTSMAAVMREAGVGICYSAEDPDGLYRAIAALVEDFPALAARSRELVPAYRAAHSPERVVTLLLDA